MMTKKRSCEQRRTFLFPDNLFKKKKPFQDTWPSHLSLTHALRHARTHAHH